MNKLRELFRCKPHVEDRPKNVKVFEPEEPPCDLKYPVGTHIVVERFNPTTGSPEKIPCVVESVEHRKESVFGGPARWVYCVKLEGFERLRSFVGEDEVCLAPDGDPQANIKTK